VLVYKGGIDDQPTARLQDLKSARNFVDEAATAQPAPHARDERAGKSIA
jgi:hypothetical protein